MFTWLWCCKKNMLILFKLKYKTFISNLHTAPASHKQHILRGTDEDPVSVHHFHIKSKRKPCSWRLWNILCFFQNPGEWVTYSYDILMTDDFISWLMWGSWTSSGQGSVLIDLCSSWASPRSSKDFVEWTGKRKKKCVRWSPWFHILLIWNYTQNKV